MLKEMFSDGLGGLAAEIDVYSGKMSAARSYAKDKRRNTDGSIMEFSVHPVTKAPIEGVFIPEWEKLKADILDLHGKLFFTGIPFIAWDIALLDDGFKVIEMNTSCGFQMLQLFRGARNDTVGQWMKWRGYLK